MRLSTRQNSKLTEIARHVVIPSGIVASAFQAVYRRACMMGLQLDQWQQDIGKLALAKRPGGKYAAGIGGVVLSIPRQTGKTYLIAALVMAICSMEPGCTVIWTAHRSRTHRETFKKLQSMTRRPRVAGYIDRVRAANGEQEIIFHNGSIIQFGAREHGFGRGFDKVDILVLDEAQILTEDAMSDMVPATNAAKNGLVFMMGTPPRPRDPGEVFTSRRKALLGGRDNGVYVEFSADENAKSDDREQLARANPSYPYRTSEEAIERMQELLGSDDNFRREALGIWDEEAASGAAIRPLAWDVLKTTPRYDGRVVYGVRFTVDGAGVALAAAYRPDDGAPVFVEPIRQANLGEGIGWLLDFLVEAAPEAAQIVVDGKAGVGSLVEELRSRGVRNKRLIIVPTLDQVIAAHSMFEQAIITGQLSHGGIELFDEQVKRAVKRKIGNAGGFGWAAPPGETVVALDAVTLAYWGARVTKRRPERSLEV